MSTSPIRLAVFASGEGTNLENIIRHFASLPAIEVALVVSNRPQSKALERARRHGIPCKVVSRTEFAEDKATVTALLHDIDYIILAGFLLRIPTYLIAEFPQRIINIHPSLLPKYGGKGMYGRHVHEAVCAAGEKESGITIHFVTEGIDEGEPIAQFSTPLTPGSETPDTIAEKIHRVEQAHFPDIIATISSTYRQA